MLKIKITKCSCFAITAFPTSKTFQWRMRSEVFKMMEQGWVVTYSMVDGYQLFRGI
jgi:hypothetical protein